MYFLISTHLFLFSFFFSSSSISNGAFRCHVLLRLILYSPVRALASCFLQVNLSVPIPSMCVSDKNHDAFRLDMIETVVFVIYLLSRVYINHGLKSPHPHSSSVASANSPWRVPASSQNRAMIMSLDDKPSGLCVVQRTWVLLKTFVHSG